MSSAEDVLIESLDVVPPAKTDPVPDSIQTLPKGVCGKKRSSLVAATPLISVSSVAEDVLCVDEASPEDTAAVKPDPSSKPADGKKKDVVCPWEDE